MIMENSQEPEKKLTSDMIGRLQSQAKVEPITAGFSTPLEAIQNYRKKEMEQPPPPPASPQQPPQPPQPPQQEVVFIDGYRLPKNFFTCLTYCIIKLNNPKVNRILKEFGFNMQDVDKRLIFPPQKKVRKKTRRHR